MTGVVIACPTTPLTKPKGKRAMPTENRAKPAGEWNHYRLTSQDGALELAVNGAVRTSRSSSAGDSFSQADTRAGSADRLVISVFGVDHPGIVAGVSQILADVGCSIADINQTVVQGKFAMVIIANASRSQASATELKERFRAEGEKLGVRIYAQREDLFHAMHRI